MGHGQYLLSSWMSLIFEEYIIVFQVLGHHNLIPCIFHGILMVKNNESNTSSHFYVERNFFFSVAWVRSVAAAVRGAASAATFTNIL